MENTTKELMRIYGYKTLFPPQVEALKHGVEHGNNLLLATPTASGKTFVGIIAIANRLLARGEGRAIYLVPLRSVAQEKYNEMKRLERLGISVGLAIGDTVVNPGARLLVSTYEKLDSMLRSRPGIIDNLKTLVVDEIHYIGDQKRGIVLESLLSQLLSRARETQIVALSATVPNAHEIAEWLGATPIISEWRPVPLREAVFADYKLYYPREDTSEEISRITGKTYLDVAIHLLSGKGQALVFSMSRRRVVQLAKQTAKHHNKLRYDKSVAREAAKRILETGGPLMLREELARLVEKGVSYHHAGLSSRQRAIIEEAFRDGGISILHATPTLAAGVNLPARVVIVEEYYRFESGIRQPIPVFEYKQMSGRAGRPGFDELGTSVIIAKRMDSPEELAALYIMSPPEEVRSRLGTMRGLRHTIMGLLARSSLTSDRLAEFLDTTLYAFQAGSTQLYRKAARAVRKLVEWGIAEEKSGTYRLTPLGGEVARQYLDPQSVEILRELDERVSEWSTILLLYLVSSMPDMIRLHATKREQEKLLDKIIDQYPDMLDLMEWFGPEEASRAKTAMLLYMWIEEAEEDTIYSETGAGPGDIRAVVETASWIAKALSRIAPYVSRHEIESQLLILSKRLRHGVRPELLVLVQIPGVGRVRARRLYNAGYKTLHDLAEASPQELLRIKGLGPSTVRAILEFFGRGGEVAGLERYGRGRGLEAFLDR